MNRSVSCCESIRSCTHKGEPSGNYEFTRVVPGDVCGFDIQVATNDCKRWHHVFSASTETEAKAIERYVRYAGTRMRERASHRRGCLEAQDNKARKGEDDDAQD